VNTLRTREQWEKFPPHPPNLKGKEARHLDACLGLPLGCMKFLFPKEFVTISGLG